MQTVAQNNFITVKTEGGILPAELLQRIADGQMEGLNPADYHLAGSEKLNEAINRAWNRLQGAWGSFKNKMEGIAPTETGTTMTRDWVLTVLQELGYGRLPFTGSLTIRTTNGETAVYPISHLYDHTPIHLVSCRQKLDTRDTSELRNPKSEIPSRSPHSLVQECLNRGDTYLWGFVSNGLRFRILRDNVSLTHAAYVEFDLEAMFTGELYSDFSLFWLLGHQSRVEIRDWRLETEEESSIANRQSSIANCWLEKWSQQAVEQGTRALDALRDGVQEAIVALGHGFLAHQANRTLREDLKSGALTTQDYYRQLLRVVYRLLFLFVAEDRELLLLPGTPAALRQQYDAYYSITRLRRLAETRRGGPHPDLYHTLTRLFSLLRGGYAPLGLPGLGGFLLSDRATPDLDAAQLANQALLDAIRALAFTVEGRVRRPVDYKNMGSEELGSVYESLLELHPRLHVGAAEFTLDVAAGSERKTTGSYYTPTSLIQSLLDTALEPVVADRLREAAQNRQSSIVNRQLEEAILAIRVVDPAAGSGHFLIAAARRLARHLARVRTGDDEPGPEAVRHALRDVVGRCIFGVDINEMAVELCKVALWMETLDPGRPLSFLDANIQCGNSLMGATPALLARGVPDEAFTPITGDDRAYCTEWKRRNRQEREGQQSLFTGQMNPWEQLGNLAAAMHRLRSADDGTLAGVAGQEAQYAQLVQSSDYEHGKLWADAWVAAFLWEKKPEHAGGWAQPLTHEIFRKLGQNPYSEKGYWAEIRRLADEYQFFHWHLAFPQVFTPREDLTGFQNLSGLDGDDDVTGWTGGFDVVLGNPPWERIKLQEKEWFASRDEAIATAPNAAARRKLIEQLPKTNPALHEAFAADKRKAEGESLFVRSSGKYPLCGRGDVNTYTIFAELARQVQSDAGRVGVIVPSGIATDDTTKYYFQDIMDSAALASLYDFENRNAIFPGVHRSYKFSLLTLTGAARPATVGAQFVFFALDVADLRDETRRFTLSAADIALLNPNTRTCPIFRGKRDAELTKAIYRRVPVLIAEGPPEVNPWGINFLRMFDMSNDSGLFRTREQLAAEGWRLAGNRFVAAVSQPRQDAPGNARLLPLYEAKMLHHFDHRWATYEGLETRDVTGTEKNDPTRFVLPRYWVREEEVNGRLPNQEKWFIGFRDIARATDERTAIFSILGKTAVGHTAPLIFLQTLRASYGGLLVAALDSLVFDYSTRQKVGGTHMTYTYLKQLPLLSPQTYHQPCPWLPISNPQSPVSAFLLPRVLELTYTAYDLRPFAEDCGYHGPPFRWDEERRFLLRCELDAAYFHLYGIGREDVAYIMDTFPIVRRKDEAAHGEYRTKRVILEMYDEMAAAVGDKVTGWQGDLVTTPQSALRNPQSYQTRLDPPPAHPDAAHPWDAAYLGPELPRDKWWQPVAADSHPRSSAQEAQEEARLGNRGYTTRLNPPPAHPDAAHPWDAAYLGPELPRDKWWQPVAADSHPRSSAQEARIEEARLGNRGYELQPPPMPRVKPVAKPALDVQPALVTDFTPPQGSYGQRLKRVMALGQPKNQLELTELIAALGDESGQIRWLAGASLVKVGGTAVVGLLAAYLGTGPGEVAQGEARKVLEMIAETDEDEAVKQAAKEALT